MSSEKYKILLDKLKKTLDKTFFQEVETTLEELLDAKNNEVVNIDALTKLKTRQFLNTELTVLEPFALRENINLGVLLINIDRFSAVNDEHGDQFGDEFLKLYANIIKQNVRSSDIVVRFAGGEFLVILVHVENSEMTLQIAKKIKDTLSNAYLNTINHDKFKKTVCVGVSIFPEDSNKIDDVIQYAKTALNITKDKSRNSLLRYQKEDISTIDLF